MFSKTLRSTTIALAILVFAAACSPAASPTPAATSTSAPAQPSPTAAASAYPAAAIEPTATQAAYTAPTAYPAAGTDATPTTASSGAAADATVYTLSADKSEARFKVREQLAGHDLPNDAIGKTSSITGSVAIKADGTIDTANSKFTVEASTLATDVSMRDGFVKRAVLQTDQYPNVVFVPSKVEGLSFPLPASGKVSFKLTGDLTIRNVTKPVTWDVTGSIANGTATGTATTSFTFEDFSLTQPKVPTVLSIVDKITLEVDVTLSPGK
jgi:polyisoprenoid-binding protein YceI